MGAFKDYFSISGRASRLQYWRRRRDLAVGAAVVIIATTFATMAGGWLGAIPFVFILPLLAAGVCVGIRRLHDRGKSAWWLAFYTIAPVVLIELAAPLGADDSVLLLAFALILASVILFVWGWIEIGFRKGPPGENRYGPAPAI